MHTSAFHLKCSSDYWHRQRTIFGITIAPDHTFRQNLVKHVIYIREFNTIGATEATTPSTPATKTETPRETDELEENDNQVDTEKNNEQSDSQS